MVIEFLCPNGHRISCPADQAGQAAKCPRCEVRFRIPELAEAIPPDNDPRADVAVSQPKPTVPENVGVPSGRTDTTRVGEPQIEFLCPNGHRLHGPRSLQGQPGECPECESKFRIPVYDDGPGEVELKLELPATAADEQTSATAASPSKQAPSAKHSLATLFSKLWSEKPPGTTVKLYLADGETLIPNRFAESLSRQSHGVFAVVEPGGTHTLTVVSWESVVRAEVQGVKKLPREMTE